MKVTKAYVARKNPAEIFSIIENILSTNLNTQIFIDNTIYEELKKNGSDYNVYAHNYLKGSHYESDDFFRGEQWLALSEGDYFDSVIAKGSFVSNCNDYMQLVEFNSSKVKNYTHYLTGFNQLLLIHFQPEP